MTHLRLLASLALALSLGSFAQAQNAASAPAPTAAPAAAPAPVAAPAPTAASSDAMEGKIAYYGSKFNWRKTASGERFNAGALTMAHNTLPFGTKVKVTNLANQRSVVVRVNDRGPTTPGRIGDLSSAAARQIRMLRSGIVEVKLEVISTPAPRKAKAKSKA